MLVSAIAEVISLGAVVPFLAVLADPVQAMQRPMVARVVAFLGMGDAPDIRLQLTLLFAGAAVASGAVRLLLIYATARLNFGIGHQISAEVYRRTLYQPYAVHVARNSSEIMGAVSKVDQVTGVILSLLNTASAIMMAVFIIAALLLIDPVVASVALFGFGFIYLAITMVTRRRLARNSDVINRAVNARIQTVQEGLGGIRDVLLDHAQPIFAARFNRTDAALRQAQASISFIGPGPRYVVEALGMVLIALLGYGMTASGGGIAAAIPTLGALALGAQRLMPLLQQIYNGWVSVIGNQQVLNDVVALLQQPVNNEIQVQCTSLLFEREIRMAEIGFRYQPHLPYVLHQVNLSIVKGARVGFLGTTGSGKSTIINLLMGLLQPSQGQICVDGSPLTEISLLAWQRNIAHVPQAIFLADASIAENIAFGESPDQIDNAGVVLAAEQAQIAEFIETSPEGYATMVGERGVRLSGGQRQRIGIARALYKKASVLVFDEATSALDKETEKSVMNAINSLGRDLTVLVIAHRLSTLSDCDVIYRLDHGHIIASGSYEEVVGKHGLVDASFSEELG